MGGSAERLYWDTSVFLCFLAPEEQERRRICEALLRNAQAGHIEICTSMYTIVEVIRPRAIKHTVPLTPEQVAKLEGMFRWPFLKKIQVHEALALKAARLARENGLKPADAIHAATALDQHASELQAWDADYGKVAHLIKVTEPAYLYTKGPIFQVANIGPTPEDFTLAPPADAAPGERPAVAEGGAPALPDDSPEDPVEPPAGG